MSAVSRALALVAILTSMFSFAYGVAIAPGGELEDAAAPVAVVSPMPVLDVISSVSEQVTATPYGVKVSDLLYPDTTYTATAMSVPIATAVVNEIRISLPVAVSGPVVDTPTLTITPALGVVHIATTVRKFVASPTPLWSTPTPSPTVVPMVAPTPVPTPDLAVARRIGAFDWRSYETDGYVFDRVDDGDRILLRSIDANADGFDFVECSSAFGVSFSSSENPTFRMGSRFVWVWGIGFSGQGECWRVVVDKG